MRRTALWSYKPGSNSARRLADALDIPIIRHENSKYRPRIGNRIINWGASSVPDALWMLCWYNDHQLVTRATNKLSFFQLCQLADTPPNIPVFSSEILEANTWLAAGKTVVARTVLTGHSGRGIIVTEPGGTLPNAPLYVQYIKKSHEFRVHLFRFGNETRVIDVQRKIRDPNREPVDWRVRSHANGFIFVRTGFDTPQEVLAQALLAFQVSGLDFGAVDVVLHGKGQRASVLEINTAPGLEGETVNKYVQAFKEMLNV